MLNRKGQQGNVYQAHQRGKWDPRSPAYGRFWIDVPGGERQRRTVSLGPCATQWVARLRLREYIERAGVNPKRAFHQNPAPGTTFRQQAEWWMESLSARRRRPLKPATIYGWQHCLDRWILPNLADELLLNVGNGALRQFVEILSAAGLAPKTIVNVVAVVKLVVASAVDEEGDQLNYYNSVLDFMGGPAGVRASYRLFMAPGMDHCGGGDGPNTFDSIQAIKEWVEAGKGPEQIMATHIQDGKTERTRPLCPYPQVATYKGTGSTDDGANFSCLAAK